MDFYVVKFAGFAASGAIAPVFAKAYPNGKRNSKAEGEDTDEIR
jgi:hypothetical protein